MSRNQSQRNLLLIDDSEYIHRLLQQRLKQEGFRMYSAENGVEGIRLAKSVKPEVILLDLSMPVMDGFEVLRAFKETEETMHIPVIVLSGSQDSEDKVMGLDLGAVDYICKPFDMAELRARVRSALRVCELTYMLAQRAQVDAITGLWNRAYFDAQLEKEISIAIRKRRPLSLAMFDVDHFKRLNDTYGHPAGDDVLGQIGQLLQETVRPTDAACRYGGEEFSVILPDTDVEGAYAMLNRVLEELESIEWRRHPERRVTASVGLCCRLPGQHEEPGQMVQAADEALYAAKQGGRNRVVVSGRGVGAKTAGSEPTAA